MTDRDHDSARCELRRRLLQAGLGAAAIGAVPGAGQLGAQAQGAFDWKRFKGEKIEVFLVKSPRGDLLTKYHKEFEDMTGITVGSEMIPEQQQRQKAVIEFNSGNTSFDVIAISYHVQKRLFGKNRWMEDVRPLVADKSLTDPNLDFADFSKGGMAWATQPDGRIDSLPFNIDPWVLYYNKELFDAKGVAYPKNFADIVDAAGKLNDPGKGVSGFVARGLKNANVPVWSSFLLGYGGGFVDAKGKLLTETSEAIDAARMYQTLLAKSGPQGVAGFNWNEAQSLFLQAKAAMWLDGIGFAQPLEDPTKSRYRRQGRLRRDAAWTEAAGVGNVRRRRGHLVVQQKEGAVVALSAMGVEQGQPGTDAAIGSGRAGAQFRLRERRGARGTEGAQSLGRLHAGFGTHRPTGLPIIVPVTEFRDIFGIALTNMINGADPASELKKATAEFQPVLDKSEKA
jgi:multiple sugar transport system substrate-binding protein